MIPPDKYRREGGQQVMGRNWLLAIFIVFLFSGQNAGAAWGAKPEEFPVPPPPLSEDLYPCMNNCHVDMETDPTPNRELEEHDGIALHHAEQFRWCLDCHDAEDRDKLRLQSGEKIDFEHSYRLCGQCHGAKYRHWREGIHGKRTGYWNGKKQYLLCVHCHNPHSPRFKPIKPAPAPRVPRYGETGENDTGGHGGKAVYDKTKSQ